MRISTFLVVSLAVAAIGCEAEPIGAPQAQRTAVPEAVGVTPGAIDSYAAPSEAPTVEHAAPATTYAPPSEYNPAEGLPEAAAPEAISSPAEPQPTVTQPPANPAVTEEPIREKAEVGVGVKGRSLGGDIITEPARAYFRVRERTAFLQVEQAINLFRGLEGRLPNSHEEFMQKVIQANNIQLPELPQGSRYVWDPEKGELMVERQR